MARRKRYYSDDDFEVGLTPSALKRLGRERQKEYMRYWFRRMFEDPANETPYNSAEGGYLYIWGGPYDAREELYDEFGRIVPEDRIEEVVAEIEADGIVDWAPGPHHPDHERARDEYEAERAQDDDTSDAEDIEVIVARLQTGLRPRFGDAYELTQRREILGKVSELRKALARVSPAHGGIGHNRPPPDEDSPQAVIVQEALDAGEVIEQELVRPEPNALEVAKATSK